jgi:hypothetical protein
MASTASASAGLLSVFGFNWRLTGNFFAWRSKRISPKRKGFRLINEDRAATAGEEVVGAIGRSRHRLDATTA